MNSLFPETSLNLFLNGVHFSTWESIYHLLRVSSESQFKDGLSLIRKYHRDPSLFISRIVKSSKFNVELSELLLSNHASGFLDFINSPTRGLYYNFLEIMEKALQLEAKICIDKLIVIDSIMKESVYFDYFLQESLPSSLLDVIANSTIIDDVIKISIGPQLLVKSFKQDFFPITGSKDSIINTSGS